MRQLTPSTFNKDSTKYSEVVTSLRSGETIPLISKSSEGNLAFASGNTYNSVKEVLGRVTHISDVTVYQNVNSLPAVDSLPLGTICVALTNGTFPMYRYQVQAGQNWNRWATLSQVLTDSLYVDDTTGKVYRATATSPYFVEVGSGGGGIAEFDGTSFNPLTAGLESGIYRCTNLEELAIVEDGEEVGSEWVGPDGLLILSANDPEYYYSYIEAGYLTWIGWSNDGENVGVYSQICQNNDVDDFLNHHGNAYRSDVAINELLAKDMIRDIQSNTTLANSKQSKIIKKLGVSVGASDWASDSTQTGYSYKAFVSIPEVLATNTAVVTFSTADANSGNYCPVASCENGGVSIWSKTNTAITLDSIVVIPDEAIDTSVNWGWKLHKLSENPDVTQNYSWTPNPNQSFLISTAVWNNNMTSFNVKSMSVNSDGYILVNNADGLPLTIWVANSTVYTALIGMFQQQGITIDATHITQQSGWIYVKDEDATNVTLYNTNYVAFWFYDGVFARWSQQSGFANWLLSNSTAYYGITIPEGVIKAYDYAWGLFAGSKLQYATLPSTLTEMGSESFGSNELLKNVIFKSSSAPTGVYSSTFSEVTCKIYVPSASLSAYQTAYGSLDFASQLVGWAGSDGVTNANDLTGVEKTANKVTSLSSSSTDTEYPSAKAVYDALSSAGGDVDLFAPIQNTVFTSKHWEEVIFTGIPNDFDPSNVWTNGIDVFYSDGGTNNLVLNKSTKTWSAKTWNGLTNIYGCGIWHGVDGNIYHTYNGTTHQLDISTSTWNSANIRFNITRNAYGFNVWSDGKYNYYCDNFKSTMWDGTANALWTDITSQWGEQQWQRPAYGYAVFSDGQNFYKAPDSFNADNFAIFDKNTNTWVAINQTNHNQWATYNTCIDGRDVFIKVYNDLYIFNRELKDFYKTSIPSNPANGTVYKDVGTNYNIPRLYWSDGEYTYCSSNSQHFVLKPDINTKPHISYK